MIDIENAKLQRIKRANTDWWIHEKAMVGANGKTYIAYYNDIGEIHVKETDAKCSRALSRDVCLCRLNCHWADEHNAPSLCVTESGRIIVAYTGHGANHTLTLRITERPFDLDSFAAPVVLSYKDSVTYAQLSENLSSNELWLFTRVRGVTWEFRYSKDGGVSWSSPNTFLSSDAGGLFYFDVRHHFVAHPEKGVVEQWFFALYGHPRISKDHTVRSGLFDSDGYLLSMDGERTDVNLYHGGKIDLDALSKVYESPNGTTVRLCAVSPISPFRVGIASFVLNEPDTITYYSATWKNGAWLLSEPIAKGGEFLSPADITDGSQTYVGGMAYYYGVGDAGLNCGTPAISHTDRIYIARFDGASRVLESYITHNGGKSYGLEQCLRSIPKEKNVKIWRPTVPIYAQDNLPVYWHEGPYGAHTGAWHSDALMYVEHDD